jgi:hypothetical protein
MYKAPLLNIYDLENYKYSSQHYNNKVEWEQGLLNLISNPQIRDKLGNEMYDDISKNHVLPEWLKYLSKFYLDVNGVSHEVRLGSDNCQVLTDNETYLDYMLDHQIINVFRQTKDCSFFYKLNIIYNMFIKEDYLDLMFGHYTGDILFANKDLPFIYRFALILSMLLYGKISFIKSAKVCFFFLFVKTNK